MRRPATRLALAVTALVGCTSGFDRNDQIVDSLRILGVSAHVDDPSGMGIDWADADIGDTVHLRALVTAPGAAAVTVTWVACVQIPGQTQPCTDEAYLRDPTQIVPLSQDPSTGVLLLGTGLDVDVQVPDIDLISSQLDMRLANAKQYPNARCALYIQIPLLVIAQDDSGRVFAAVKNLRLSPWKTIAQANDASYAYYIRNSNPTITAFNISPTGVGACDGQPLATPCRADTDCPTGATCAETGFCSGGGGVFPDGDQTICLATDQPPQSYYTCGLDGPQIDDPGDPPNVPEQPNVTWYMTGGALGSYPMPMNGSGGSVASRTFTHFTRPPGPFTIYGVIRDNRDGQNWIVQDFQ
jgi:hypothetical protein